MNENKEQQRHSPLAYAIYNKLKNNHAGMKNAISAADLAAYFGIDKRLLRLKIHDIRESNSPDFETCIVSGDGGYWCAVSWEDYKRANHRLFSAAFSLLRCARANSRKASLHNQGKITDVESEFSEFFKSFMEDDN